MEKVEECMSQEFLMVVERFGKAAEKGNFGAFCSLKKAAEGGDSNAQFYIARIYEHGKVIQGDDSKALKWYQLAAQQGNPRAQYHLGLMYKKQGRGDVIQNGSVKHSKNMLGLEDPLQGSVSDVLCQ